VTPGRVFHPQMQCFVESVSYDFETRVGVVTLRDGGCTDMSGTIKTFVKIDPKVQQIHVFSDGVLDIVYNRVDPARASQHREPHSWDARAQSFGSAGWWEPLDVRFGRRAAAR
jgi:hypothetical protein